MFTLDPWDPHLTRNTEYFHGFLGMENCCEVSLGRMFELLSSCLSIAANVHALTVICLLSAYKQRKTFLSHLMIIWSHPFFVALHT